MYYQSFPAYLQNTKSISKLPIYCKIQINLHGNPKFLFRGKKVKSRGEIAVSQTQFSPLFCFTRRWLILVDHWRVKNRETAIWIGLRAGRSNLLMVVWFPCRSWISVFFILKVFCWPVLMVKSKFVDVPWESWLPGVFFFLVDFGDFPGVFGVGTRYSTPW